MGPNRNLRLQLHFAHHINEAAKKGKKIDLEDARELASLVIELNEHLVAGGELPRMWQLAKEDEAAAEDGGEDAEEAVEEEAEEEEGDDDVEEEDDAEEEEEEEEEAE